jgi:hypothetical protein
MATAQPTATPAANVVELPAARRAVLNVLVRDVHQAQLSLVGALRHLETCIDLPAARGDLVLAMEKGEASAFYFRMMARTLARHHGINLPADMQS